MSTTSDASIQPPTEEKKGLKKIEPLIGCKHVGLTGAGWDPNVKPEVLPDEDPDRLVWWVFDQDYPDSGPPDQPYLYLPESVYNDEYYHQMLGYHALQKRLEKKREKRKQEGEISAEDNDDDVYYGAWVYVETNERYGVGKSRFI